MKQDSDPMAASANSGDVDQTVQTRADMYRERFHKAQVVAAQIARARSAGGTPNDAEAARLIAEFHARGGRVTVCPEPPEPETSAAAHRTGRNSRE